MPSLVKASVLGLGVTARVLERVLVFGMLESFGVTDLCANNYNAVLKGSHKTLGDHCTQTYIYTHTHIYAYIFCVCDEYT